MLSPHGGTGGAFLSGLHPPSLLRWCLVPGGVRSLAPSSSMAKNCLWSLNIPTPSLSWTAHVRHLVSRGNRWFAQRVAWSRSERVPLRFASTLFMSYVLSSISWGVEFFISSPPALQVVDTALRRCSRFCLSWPTGVPPSLLFSWNWGGLTLPHQHQSTALSLFG